MKESLYGELSVIGMRGCEQFVAQVDSYLESGAVTTVYRLF